MLPHYTIVLTGPSQMRYLHPPACFYWHFCSRRKKHSYIFLGEETVLNDIENCVYEIMKQGVEVDESESRVLYEFAQGIILIYALKYVSYRTTGKIPESYSEDEAEILQSGEIDEFFEHCFE